MRYGQCGGRAVKRVSTVLLCFVAALATIASAQVPQMINYQGRVVVNGTNYHGTGQFKFALVDGAGTASFWSNDGTSTNGSEPTASVALMCKKGLFSVALGDTATMASVPSTIFTNSDVRIRTWFSDGGGFQLLSPDQRIVAVGYAMVASSVDGDPFVEKAGDTMRGPLRVTDGTGTSGYGGNLHIGESQQGADPKLINFGDHDLQGRGWVSVGERGQDDTLELRAQRVYFSPSWNGNYAVGIGVSNPVERLEVAGGITLGNSSTPKAGTVRWSGTDFEGYDGSQWVSLTLRNLSSGSGRVDCYQKISDTQGDFTGTLDDWDAFSFGMASLGDLDGDGTGDIGVGAVSDDDGGDNRGAVWVLFLNRDGTVKSHQKISDTEGSFSGVLDNEDNLGRSLTSLGDFDSDGNPELVVGAPGDDDGGSDRGAVWILFLNGDGTVRSHQKISDTHGNFSGILDDSDYFGASTASLGDLDGDGIADLAVGATGDADGGTQRGAVWVLFMNSDGTVKGHEKISDTQGDFTGTLDDNDLFGASVVSLGDFDADNVNDLAVGAREDDDGGTDHGAVWMLFLETNGTVKSHQKISDTQGSFAGVLGEGDRFGTSLALLGDLDGDGTGDMAVGANHDDDGGSNRGAIWILFLAGDGTVRSYQKISDSRGSFAGILDDNDYLGYSMDSLGDLDGDGIPDLAVGAVYDDDGGGNRGAVWILFMGRGLPPGGQ